MCPVIQLGNLARQVQDVAKVTLVGVSLASPRETRRTARTVRFMRPHSRQMTRTVSLHRKVICELISEVELHLADLDVDGKIILKRFLEN